MNRIFELRKQAGYSQAELADLLRIAQNTLSQYETSKRTPSINTIEKLANFFNVSPNYILGVPEHTAQGATENDKVDITGVTKIFCTEDVDEVNMYLKLGWRLLHVGQYTRISDDGFGSADIEYTIGWFGDPADTIDEPFEDNDGRYVI